MNSAGSLYDMGDAIRERPMSGKSFERFYYERVALGEGCGCAEQIIGIRDLEARAREAALGGASDGNHGEGLAWLGRFFRRQRRDPQNPA